MHDRKSTAKYEKLLGRKFQEDLPPDTEYSRKSIAWTLVQKVSSFWKAVKGESPNIKTPDFRQ